MALIILCIERFLLRGSIRIHTLRGCFAHCCEPCKHVCFLEEATRAQVGSHGGIRENEKETVFEESKSTTYQDLYPDLDVVIENRGNSSSNTNNKSVSQFFTTVPSNASPELTKFYSLALSNNVNSIAHMAGKGNASLWKELHQLGFDVNTFLYYQDTTKPRALTPLQIAARKGNLDVIDTLIKLGADVEAKDEHNFTALDLAIRSKQYSAVKLLCQLGAEIESEGRLPIHHAVINNDSEMARLLVSLGANINYKPNRVNDFFNGVTGLHIAVENRSRDMIVTLLDLGANLEERATKFERTPLHFCCQSGNSLVLKLLIKRGANIEAKDKDDHTPLHYAAQSGKTEIVNTLIENGANIEAKDKDLFMPLHTAASFGQTELVKILLECGANIESRAGFQRTPLHHSIRAGHTETVKFLLDHGANIEAKNSTGSTPLHVAAEFAKIRAVKTIFEQETTFNGNLYAHHNQDGLTKALQPLQNVADEEQLAIAKILISKGARIESTDKDGSTPLFFAAKQGDLEMLTFLLENGANPNCINKHKKTPLVFAALNKQISVTKKLIQAGADLQYTARFAKSRREEEILETLKDAGFDIPKNRARSKSCTIS
eukprot:TRINITY_DN2086_c0_g2_i1.p1 TRINITY_DN2086_c0_g2~~TRINITY_DN2086_c0_g2_i1.p1  ORF type:complete len:604 (-),score=99.20 TRINITY_DN2086_c0_g2_i1:63-1874(-)